MIVPFLKCEETGDIYTVLVQQPRIGWGRLNYEFPAGKTEDVTDARMVAAREIREEVGIHCDPSDLILLSELFQGGDQLYPVASPYFEEMVRFYGFVKTMKKEDIMSLQGASTGADPDEQITVHVVLFDDVFDYIYECSSLSCYFLARNLLKRGLIV
jgi:8-oxo-dGTP pyrophosphatase MutT (NUDIX family)